MFDEFNEKTEALVSEYRERMLVQEVSAERKDEGKRKQKTPSVTEISRLLEQEKKAFEA